MNVLAYKPLITEPEKFQNTKYLLYRYATRMLLELVPWLSLNYRQVGEGDGFAEIIFSNRSNMSCDDMRNYLRLLIQQHDADPLRSVEHCKLARLQVADAIASGFHFAVKVNRYGETGTGYLPHL